MKQHTALIITAADQNKYVDIYKKLEVSGVSPNLSYIRRVIHGTELAFDTSRRRPQPGCTFALDHLSYKDSARCALPSSAMMFVFMFSLFISFS